MLSFSGAGPVWFSIRLDIDSIGITCLIFSCTSLFFVSSLRFFCTISISRTIQCRISASRNPFPAGAEKSRAGCLKIHPAGKFFQLFSEFDLRASFCPMASPPQIAFRSSVASISQDLCWLRSTPSFLPSRIAVGCAPAFAAPGPCALTIHDPNPLILDFLFKESSA